MNTYVIKLLINELQKPLIFLYIHFTNEQIHKKIKYNLA